MMNQAKQVVAIVVATVAIAAAGCTTTSSVPQSVANPELVARFQQDNPIPSHMARVYILHDGAWKQKQQIAQVVLHDIQFEGDNRYRFRQGEYVVFDVPANSRQQVKTWAVCGRSDNTPVNLSEPVHPDKTGFRTLTFDTKLPALQAGKPHVFKFNPDCWVNIHGGASSGLSYHAFIRLEKVANPFALVYDKKKAGIVVQ